MGADLGGVLTAATDFGDLRYAEGKADGAASRQAEIDHLRDQATEAQGALVALQAAYDAHMATHAPAEPPQPPAPLIGMSAPANLWAARKAAVESTGGKLQARRIFFEPSDGLSTNTAPIAAAHAEGLLPVVSYKPGSWADVAAGKSDAALRRLADALATLKKPVVVALHHEPDQQSDGPDIGEGGTAADFAAMQARALPILKTAPNVQVAVIMNGWWWTDRRAALTDAQIEAWLPRSLREQLDVIASDDYSPSGGEPAVVKTRNRVAWAKRVGGVKALGIGETNAFTAAELADVFAFVKSEPLFRGGWALVWNATGTTYQPLEQTGLLDDFRAILRDWSA